jgi:hypothetical protein
MYLLFASGNDKCGWRARSTLVSLGALLLYSGISALAQSTAPPLNANRAFSIQAIHLLGWPNTRNNCKGTLSTQDNLLQFQQGGKPVTQVNIASVRHVFLGEESMQVGGVPMKIGKAAAPYGAGRVVSLFAHKKYDTLTLEYVDSDGGVHGAIFQMLKGQGELVRTQLLARGASSRPGEGRAASQDSFGVTHEDK